MYTLSITLVGRWWYFCLLVHRYEGVMPFGALWSKKKSAAFCEYDHLCYICISAERYVARRCGGCSHAHLFVLGEKAGRNYSSIALDTEKRDRLVVYEHARAGHANQVWCGGLRQICHATTECRVLRVTRVPLVRTPYTKVRPHVAETLHLEATLALFAQKLGDAWCLPGTYPS